MEGVLSINDLFGMLYHNIRKRGYSPTISLMICSKLDIDEGNSLDVLVPKIMDEVIQNMYLFNFSLMLNMNQNFLKLQKIICQILKVNLITRFCILEKKIILMLIRKGNPN